MMKNLKMKIWVLIGFLFLAPAEEGAPEGEEGGAPLMIKEGALENPKVDAIFGLHVVPLPAGMISLTIRKRFLAISFISERLPSEENWFSFIILHLIPRTRV